MAVRSAKKQKEVLPESWLPGTISKLSMSSLKIDRLPLYYLQQHGSGSKCFSQEKITCRLNIRRPHYMNARVPVNIRKLSSCSRCTGSSTRRLSRRRSWVNADPRAGSVWSILSSLEHVSRLITTAARGYNRQGGDVFRNRS